MYWGMDRGAGTAAGKWEPGEGYGDKKQDGVQAGAVDAGWTIGYVMRGWRPPVPEILNFC